MKTTGQSIQLVNGKWMCYEHCSAGSSLTEVNQPSTMTCDADKFMADIENDEGYIVLPQFTVDMGNVGCYTCPPGTLRAGTNSGRGSPDGAMRCFPEEEFGCVTCPAGQHLLCSDSWLNCPEMSRASNCDCYESSAMTVIEIGCEALGVETAVMSHGSVPSKSPATATECSGSDGCECDYETQGQPRMHPSFNREMCLKCPDPGYFLGLGWHTPTPMCYSCPAGKIMLPNMASGLVGPSSDFLCYDECPAGSFLIGKTAASIVTSDKLRCFKTNAATPAAAPAAPTVAEVAPADSTFFVTM